MKTEVRTVKLDRGTCPSSVDGLLKNMSFCNYAIVSDRVVQIYTLNRCLPIRYLRSESIVVTEEAETDYRPCCECDVTRGKPILYWGSAMW
jgi:hypothetical protein